MDEAKFEAAIKTHRAAASHHAREARQARQHAEALERQAADQHARLQREIRQKQKRLSAAEEVLSSISLSQLATEGAGAANGKSAEGTTGGGGSAGSEAGLGSTGDEHITALQLSVSDLAVRWRTFCMTRRLAVHTP